MANHNAPPSPLNEYVHALLTDDSSATAEQKVVLTKLKALHAKRAALKRELEATREHAKQVEEGLANLEGAIQISAEFLHELNPAVRSPPPKQLPRDGSLSYDEDLGKRD